MSDNSKVTQQSIIQIIVILLTVIQVKLEDTRDCTVTPCQNGGTCESDSGRGVCDCLRENGGYFCEILEDCNNVIGESSGTIESPNFGNGTYYPWADCRWILNAANSRIIHLEFTSFDVEPHDSCTNDSVLVREGDNSVTHGVFCGNSIPHDITSTTSSLWITFTSNACTEGAGFSASFTTLPADCASNPCLNDASCVDNGSGVYACDCIAGFTGENCGTNVDECASDPCEGGGTCRDGVNGYTCECAPDYTGVDCQANIDDCASDPCLNGGTCIDGTDIYSCLCEEGWTGTNCDVDIDECASSPCQNGGVCVDGPNVIDCNCQDGFEGPNCSININDCAGSPCVNGGVCVDGVGMFRCDCLPGFSGDNCEVKPDDCASSPCANGGTCADGADSYICMCDPGYTGINCEANIKECASTPCENGGTCVDAVSSYICMCVSGYTGPTCSSNVDDCSTNPCENGGTCVDGVNSYTCTCTSRFSGDNCEVSRVNVILIPSVLSVVVIIVAVTCVFVGRAAFTRIPRYGFVVPRTARFRVPSVLAIPPSPFPHRRPPLRFNKGFPGRFRP